MLHMVFLWTFSHCKFSDEDPGHPAPLFYSILLFLLHATTQEKLKIIKNIRICRNFDTAGVAFNSIFKKIFGETWEYYNRKEGKSGRTVQMLQLGVALQGIMGNLLIFPFQYSRRP